MHRIYLDNVASAPLSKQVRKAIRKYTRQFIHGNPSSLHTEGRYERQLIEQARESCAQALGCNADEIFFTSGASESNSWAQKIWHLNTYKTHDSFGKGYNTDIYAVSYYNNETGHFDCAEIPKGYNILVIKIRFSSSLFISVKLL